MSLLKRSAITQQGYYDWIYAPLRLETSVPHTLNSIADLGVAQCGIHHKLPYEGWVSFDSLS